MQFSNKSKTKALQTSSKHWFRTGVHRLAIHLGLHDPAEDEIPEFRYDHLENPEPVGAFKWPTYELEHLMRAKARSMEPPLRLTISSKTLHVTVKNRQGLPGKKDRLRQIILRAMHFRKEPWVDNIRLQYRGDDLVPAIGFAKCMGFFGDDFNNNYVAIQWYKICGRLPIDRVSRMYKVELIESYQFVPVGSILNGALIVPLAIEPAVGHPHQFWAVQSHREGASLQNVNS